jgi:hypothetical protein
MNMHTHKYKLNGNPFNEEYDKYMKKFVTCDLYW